jgi:predicted anti-sigma-YlaC factor YlaD
MHNQVHPDPEQLDRLRAGLFDDAADEKAALEQHLGECSSCRSQFEGWEQLGQAMMDAQLPADALQRDLQRARRVTLQSHRTRRIHTFAPYATAALLLVAVTIGLWTIQPGNESQPLLTSQSVETIPDSYEDLDFYLWLANEEDSGGDEDHGKPNNT